MNVKTVNFVMDVIIALPWPRHGRVMFTPKIPTVFIFQERVSG